MNSAVIKINKKQPYTIAILGAGVGGIAVLAELIRQIEHHRLYHIQLVVIDRQIGMGRAYKQFDECLFLNTSADLNSVIPGKPLHFVKWLATNKNIMDASSFVPRRWFAEYLYQTYEALVNEAKTKNIQIKHVVAQAKHIKKTQQYFEVMTEHNTYYSVDQVIVATGDFSKSQPHIELLEAENYYATPYLNANMFKKIVSNNNNILVIGSRLSAIDTTLLLQQNQFKGQIVLSSCSGLLPAVRTRFSVENKNYFDHTKTIPELIERFDMMLPPASNTINKDMIEVLQSDIQAAKSSQNAWQAYVYSFAQRLNYLWRSAGNDEQAFFKKIYKDRLSRYVTSFPLQTAEKIKQLCDSGQLTLHKNLVRVKVTNKGKKFNAQFYDKKLSTMSFTHVFNATGQYIPSYNMQMLMSSEVLQSKVSGLHTVGSICEHSNQLALNNAIFIIAHQASKIAEQVMKHYTRQYSQAIPREQIVI